MSSARSGHAVQWFLVLLVLFSIPFWVLGAVAGKLSTPDAPVNLPISALMAVNPLLVAIILTYRNAGANGVKTLLRRVFDFDKVQPRWWYLAVFGIMPLVMVIEYVILLLLGTAIPNPVVPITQLPIMFIVFFVFAIGEEVGWQGYLYEPLRARLSPLSTALVLGFIWASWHIIPYFQTGNTAAWVLWQCIASIGLRIIMVWLYTNTQQSLFSAVVFHSMINVSNFMFPNYGSAYDPMITAIILGIGVVVIIVFWGRSLRTVKRPLSVR